MSHEPAGEPLMQLRPVGFGQPLVGGIADQQVTEAECPVVFEGWPVGPDQLLAYQRIQVRVELRF